jgi:hypothetical protein
LELSEEVVEGFGEGGVCEDGVAQGGVGELAHHSDLELGHDFAAFKAEDGGAEDLIGSGIDDGFHEAAGFVDFEGAGDVIHGHFGYTDRAILRAGFGFGETDAAKLRVDEDGVGHQAIGSGGAAAFEQVGAQDAEIVVGNVRESGAALDVAEGEDVLRGGFELFVDADEAVGIGRDCGGEEIQRVGVGNASSGHEEMGAFDFAGFSSGAEFHGDAIARAGDFFDGGVEMKLEAVFPEDAGDGFGDVLVFSAEELRIALENGDATAEAAKELREFEADVASAENKEMRGNFGEFHDRSAIQVGDVRQARNIGNGGAASRVDEKLVGGEVEFAALGGTDDDGFGASERGLAIDEIEVLCFGDAALAAGAEGDDDVALAFADPLHGDAQGAGVDAVIDTTAGEIGDAAAGDHGLGGRAAFVDAGAADVNFLDQRGAQAGVGKGLAKGSPALAGADDHGVVMLRGRHKGRRGKGKSAGQRVSIVRKIESGKWEP